MATSAPARPLGEGTTSVVHAAQPAAGLLATSSSVAADAQPSSVTATAASRDTAAAPMPTLHAAASGEATPPAPQREAVLARIWDVLNTIEDPEIPVSLVGMGLIVSVDYTPASRAARIQVTFTAMGCAAIDMIQDDIKEHLLRDPDIASVETEVVWDPVWTRKRLSDSARATMRELGIAA